MNKLLLCIFASLSVGVVSADISLDRISKAIKDKDLSRVKTLWKTVDRHTSTIQEKREKMNTLIYEASDLDYMELAHSTSSFKPYAKMGSGFAFIILGAVGMGFAEYYRVRRRINNQQYIGGVLLSCIPLLGGNLLFESGRKELNSDTNQLKQGEQIARYFEECLDELDELDEEK